MTNPDLWSDAREPMVEIAPGKWIRAGVAFQVFSPGSTGPDRRSFRCECGCNVFHAQADGRVRCNDCDVTFWAE